MGLPTKQPGSHDGSEPTPGAADEPSPFATDPSAGDDVLFTPEVSRSAGALLGLIADDECSEVLCNGPNDIMYKTRGQRFHASNIRFEDPVTYHRVLNEVVLPYVDTPDRIDGSTVLVEGQMEMPSGEQGIPPMVARVHILAPPLVSLAKVTIAKKARYELTLDDMAARGAMTPAMADFLKSAAHARLTMVVSGPTGAGKTTLLQAISRHFDQNDRVVVIEDTPELKLSVADVVYLCSSSQRPGQDPSTLVTTEWLVKAANRMRMDRVVVGECRGGEIAEWLIAANSGAEGSATTVHADSPRRALDKILALASKGSTGTEESTLRREIASTLDLVVQASLVDGRHVITAIEDAVNTMVRGDVISTQTLFSYDRSTHTHKAFAPSDDLRGKLEAAGTPWNPAWSHGAAKA